MPILDQMVLEQNTEVGLEGLRRTYTVESEDIPTNTDVSPLLGCEVDAFQDDLPAWEGDQQPRVCVLLGP